MRVMRAHLPAEMLAFWLVEFVLGMAMFYVLMVPAGTAAGLDVGTANRAARIRCSRWRWTAAPSPSA